MQVIDLNHIALPVNDLHQSVYFYHNQLGLELIQRPNFDFDGAWIKLGATQELHLIAKLRHITNQAPRERHFALQVKSIDEAEKTLKGSGIKFDNKKKRPDGAWQIFLQDPDGYFIELCELV